MKVIVAAVYLLASMFIPLALYADGCYLCEGGGYVKYVGEDTFAKRKEAQDKLQCKVTGTTSTCSNEKGLVGYNKK